MNYSVIKYNDIANGIGIRTSLFVSGCRNRCKGCFQPETWCFSYGEEFTKEVEDKIFESMNEYTSGITLLGGDPMEPENVKVLLPFIERFRKEFPDKNVWAYTGYLIEDLVLRDEETKRFILENIDVLVDGPFIESQKDITLKFKGSKNQRIIDVKKSKIPNISLYKF